MKTYVMIPTYNERENIGNLIQEILNLKISDLRIVVVDDNSPDGTSVVVKDLSREHQEVELLLRTTERGRGAAGIAGFKHALEHGADCIIEMDADFSSSQIHPLHVGGNSKRRYGHWFPIYKRRRRRQQGHHA